MSQPKIVTVTLNASLERTLVVHFFAEGYENHTVESSRLDPAGEGLNIARALHKLGAPAHALALVGNDASGLAFRALLDEEDLESTIVTANGHTSNKTIILDTGNNSETQLIEDGDLISEEVVAQTEKALRQLTQPDDIVVFAGHLPSGAPTDAYARLTEVSQESGGRVNLASMGSALHETLHAEPELLRLSQLEMEGYFNFPVRETQDVLVCAQKLNDLGAGSVLLEMRASGNAMLFTPQGAWLVSVPSFQEGTSSGMWDALFAAFLYARLERESFPDALALGAAAATYTASKVGSRFGSLKQFKKIAEQIEVFPVQARPTLENSN